MNKTQLRTALKQLENVSQFSQAHGIPIRTIWRLRKRGASPTKKTAEKFKAALIKDGIINEDGSIIEGKC